MTDRKTPKRMSVIELEQYLKDVIPPNGISSQMIYNHIRRAGLKADAFHKYDTAEFLQAYAGAKERDNKSLGAEGVSSGQDPRRYKLLLECSILKIKHDQLKGSLIPITEHQSAIREMAVWVRDTHLQWIADVKVMTGNPDVVADAERLRDNLFARMREKAGAKESQS